MSSAGVRSDCERNDSEKHQSYRLSQDGRRTGPGAHTFVLRQGCREEGCQRAGLPQQI